MGIYCACEHDESEVRKIKMVTMSGGRYEAIKLYFTVRKGENDDLWVHPIDGIIYGKLEYLLSTYGRKVKDLPHMALIGDNTDIMLYSDYEIMRDTEVDKFAKSIGGNNESSI